MSTQMHAQHAQIPTQISTQILPQTPTQTPIQIPTIPMQIPNQFLTQFPAQFPTQISTQTTMQTTTQIPTQIPTQISTQIPTHMPLTQIETTHIKAETTENQQLPQSTANPIPNQFNSTQIPQPQYLSFPPTFSFPQSTTLQESQSFSTNPPQQPQIHPQILALLQSLPPLEQHSLPTDFMHASQTAPLNFTNFPSPQNPSQFLPHSYPQQFHPQLYQPYQQLPSQYGPSYHSSLNSSLHTPYPTPLHTSYHTPLHTPFHTSPHTPTSTSFQTSYPASPLTSYYPNPTPLHTTLHTPVHTPNDTPPDSPPSVPQETRKPKKEKPRRIDLTKVFQSEFQDLLRADKQAKRDWKGFRRSVARSCTYKWCIRVKREFCEKYGGDFAELLRDARFQGLGSRTDCVCKTRETAEKGLDIRSYCVKEEKKKEVREEEYDKKETGGRGGKKDM
eukprot:Phypoly_transcript_07056.p1 GENE.Phypoly_transcript_07056~~Phypoly_transcript_07056.p1  ORF type:complete len:446 (+),score=121.82 Phypoly_transcript_07056:211-1548(+)